MKVGIIIAMDIEYQKMAALFGGKAEGVIAGNDIVLWRCGIGKVNAAVGTMRLIQQHHPDCIISTGLAGGIDNSLHVKDIIVGRQTIYHDFYCGMGCELGQVQGLPARFDGDARLLQAALTAERDGDINVVAGLMCTGDQFITDRTAQSKIKENFPEGLACEMESAAIAQTCYLNDIPFLGVRVISDTPGNTDNHQMQWDEFLASMGDHSFRFVHQFLSNLPKQF